MRKALISMLFSAALLLGYPAVSANAAETVTETVTVDVAEDPLMGDWSDLSTRPTEEQNADTLTVSSKAIALNGYVYYFVEFSEADLDADYISVFTDDESTYRWASDAGAYRYETLSLYSKVTSGSQEITVAAYSYEYNDETYSAEYNLLAAKNVTVNVEEYSSTFSIGSNVLTPDSTSVSGYAVLPADVDGDVTVKLYDGTDCVAASETLYSGYEYRPVASLLSDMQMAKYFQLYSSYDDGYASYNGSIKFAKKPVAGKAYTVKVYVDGEEQSGTFGTVSVQSDAMIIGAWCSTSFSSDYPVVDVQYANAKPADLTVKLVKDGAEIASSEGGEVYPYSSSGAYYELPTTASATELNGALIQVEDAQGTVLYNSSYYYTSHNVTDAYYDYQANQVVCTTYGLPDGTEISATITYEDEEYTAAGVVSGNHVTLAFSKDGEAWDLPSGSHYITLSYQWQNPGYEDSSEYTYGHSRYVYIYGNSSSGSYNYNYTSPWRFNAGETSYSFTYYLSESYVGEATGDFAGTLVTYSDSEQVGDSFALTAETEERNSQTVYVLTGTWKGDALEEGKYYLQVSRGGTYLSEYNIVVMSSDNVYGYVGASASNSGSKTANVYLYNVTDADPSKIALQFADYVGNTLDISYTLDTDNTRSYSDGSLSAYFTIGDIPSDLLGVKVTATYDGKPVYYYWYLPEHTVGTATISEAAASVSYSTYYPEDAEVYGYYGAQSNVDGVIQVREVGTMKLLKEIPVSANTWTQFTESMLDGLSYNDGTVKYRLTFISDGKYVSTSEWYLAVWYSDVEDVFSDVDTSWYTDAVQYLYNKGYMTGKGDGVFDVAGNITRAEFVQILYSVSGKPEVTYTAQFGDVADGEWYTSAILWAYQQGITSGYDNGNFGVSDKITREQIALMLYRFAQKNGYATNADASMEGYSDTGSIDSWATTGIQWAVTQGVISGKTVNGALGVAPLANATRTECAQMMYKLLTSK